MARGWGRVLREFKIQNFPHAHPSPVSGEEPRSGGEMGWANKSPIFFATFGGKSGAKATHHISGGAESHKA